MNGEQIKISNDKYQAHVNRGEAKAFLEDPTLYMNKKGFDVNGEDLTQTSKPNLGNINRRFRF